MSSSNYSTMSDTDIDELDVCHLKRFQIVSYPLLTLFVSLVFSLFTSPTGSSRGHTHTIMYSTKRGKYLGDRGRKEE